MGRSESNCIGRGLAEMWAMGVAIHRTSYAPGLDYRDRSLLEPQASGFSVRLQNEL